MPSKDRLSRCFFWMKRGVSITDPASTFIGEKVKLGIGTVIEPFCILKGSTSVGKRCVIGPFTRLNDTKIGDAAVIDQSVVDGAVVKKGAQVGPFTRIRPGTVVGEGAHLGNFCEFKKAKIGKGVKASHLSYLGDVTIGEGSNIGAGTITANYDGKNKFKTKIGRRAFIGSGTVLVAPVSVGDSAMTGAGAVLLKGRNVPKNGVAVGVPAHNLGKKRG